MSTANFRTRSHLAVRLATPLPAALLGRPAAAPLLRDYKSRDRNHRNQNPQHLSHIAPPQTSPVNNP
jgi:hypothetical protein